MRVLLFVFITSAIILSALATMFPEVLLNPGPLMKAHHAKEKDCLSCHKPFAGVASVQCISCHKQNDISYQSFIDIPLIPKPIYSSQEQNLKWRQINHLPCIFALNVLAEFGEFQYVFCFVWHKLVGRVFTLYHVQESLTG